MDLREHEAWRALSPHRDEDGVILHFGDPRAELEALRREKAFHDGGTDRVLQVTGADRVDLLQRLSAGRVSGHEPGEACRLPFTDAKGRLVDVPWARFGAEELRLICGNGRRERLQAWIEAYTILEDVNCAPGEGFVLVERELAAPPLCLEPERARAGIEELLAEGRRPAGAIAHAQWCAEQLHFRPGLDLDERFHPLEVGLREHVDFQKGCFIGQEVIARLQNYDKVRRRPALLHGAAPLPRKTELRGAERRGAEVVRSARRLDADGAYALAVLDREIEEGAALHAEDGAEWTVVRASRI